jgi:hypothetical protein
MNDLMSLQGVDYVIPKEKAHIVERLYRFCAQSQALEPQLPAYALATRLCGTFQSYVVGLGTKIVEDRKAEVGGAWRMSLLTGVTWFLVVTSILNALLFWRCF